MLAKPVVDRAQTFLTRFLSHRDRHVRRIGELMRGDYSNKELAEMTSCHLPHFFSPPNDHQRVY